MRLPLSESTHKGEVKEADKVEAFVTPGGTTTSDRAAQKERVKSVIRRSGGEPVQIGSPLPRSSSPSICQFQRIKAILLGKAHGIHIIPDEDPGRERCIRVVHESGEALSKPISILDCSSYEFSLPDQEADEALWVDLLGMCAKTSAKRNLATKLFSQVWEDNAAESWVC